MKSWEGLLTEIYKGEKIDMECKKAKNSVPDSVYETYSSFANTQGGTIVLGVEEDKSKVEPRDRFIVCGVSDPEKLRVDFWNTINSQKVNANILVDEDVYILKQGDISLLVIEVPRADFTVRPVYKGENPYKGTFKRNHEGDYHAKEYEVRAMIRDQSDKGNDSTILEGYTMDDIDPDTLKRYRIKFNNWNPDHVWGELDDKEFLEMLGGYRRDRREKVEGLTVAGLMMFGTGLAIRDEFENIFMDYRDESSANAETRWVDRVTYDGTWENNLYNFFRKVMPKLTENLKKPFVLENQQRVEDTPMHKAIREAFVNMIIHADYRMDAGVLRIIISDDSISFSNPGSLKLPKTLIYQGGESKARNPHIQTMFRMIGYGDNAGSGFPAILNVWKKYGFIEPDLAEDTITNKVTLLLKFVTIYEDSKIIRSVPGEVKEAFSRYNSDGLSEDTKNERRLSENLSGALSEADYKKVEAIVSYLEENKSITPKIAETITGKSSATVRRYLKMLAETGYVKVEGNTTNTRYVVL